MKAFTTIISALLIGSSLLGCDSGSTQHPDSSEEQAALETQELDRKQNKLGDKWLVNDEMKPFIEQAEVRLQEHKDKQSTDYALLAADLKSKNGELIKSCTMEGESHDALHEWLYPHIELLKALEQAENINQANAIIDKLHISFKTYHQSFQ